VTEAAAFIAAGLCDVVVVVQARSGMRIGPAPVQQQQRAHTSYESLGLLMAGFYAQMATRHMHEFGTTSEQLAEVAVAFRHHATLNPRSVMGPKGPITVDDVLNSRMISTPLHLLDCCIDNDGGYAFVMTTTERAQDLRKPPIGVMGGQTALWSGDYDELTPNYHPSPAVFTGRSAMEQAGITHDDIDVLGIYDCFTITVIRLLEDLGFCGIGDGGPFVEGGTLGLKGRFPTNLDGGLLSHSHVGSPAGLHVIEVARQLWQEVEPERQVDSPRIGLCHHQGMAVLGRHGTCVLARA
jgi:acetyl-CoA acetyltransferase